MRPATGYLTVTLLLIVWLSVRPLLDGDTPLGSQANPIRIMLTPSTDAQAIIRDGEVLARYITQRTGLHVTVAVPNFYITVVEAFCTNRADIAIMNTFSYLLAHKKYGANAVMRVARRYGELSYRGEFIVHAESGIESIDQLRGKSIAYVDPSSTSGYIYPKDMLRKRGITPRQEMFAYGHNQVVTKVYTRDVDAGAVFYSRPDTVTGEQLDARTKIKTEHPDVFQKVRVIGLTEEIPNDPVVARKGLDRSIISRICEALLSFQQTDDGKKALMTIASVEGFQRTSDAAYNDVRTLVASYGVDVEKQLRKSKK